MKILLALGIIQRCPNCESAWTGGHPNPEEIHWCMLCGSGPKGWIWGWIIPQFAKDWIVKQRLEAFQNANQTKI